MTSLRVGGSAEHQDQVGSAGALPVLARDAAGPCQGAEVLDRGGQRSGLNGVVPARRGGPGSLQLGLSSVVPVRRGRWPGSLQ